MSGAGQESAAERLPQVPDLSGKVAVVTGASRGIGKCLALELARAGADIVVAAKSEQSRDKLPGSIHQTAEEVEALGRRALAVRTNVREVADLENLVATTVRELGRIDIVVNNAGALHWRPMVDTPAKRYDLMMEVNARAAYVLSQLVLPHLLERGDGAVVQMSPPLDLRMLGGKVGYCMSKFGMSLLATGLAQETAKTGIRSFALWPATAIESQATINHGLGGPADWRKPEILADALLAAMVVPRDKVHGRWLIDEDVLAEAGVTDLARYSCVPGGKPIRIVDEGSAAALWSS